MRKQTDDQGSHDGGTEIDQQPCEPRTRGVDDVAVKVALGDAAHAHQVFFVFLVNDVDHVVDGDRADQTALLVHHGSRDQISVREQECDFFLVHGRRNQFHLGRHDVGDRHGALGPQQPAERNRAERAVVAVDHEDVVESLGQRFVFVVGVLTHEVYGLADGPLARHADQLALHHAAGRILRISEAGLEDGAILFGDRVQDLLLFAFVQFLEHHHRVVAVELTDGGGQVFDADLFDDVVADGFVQFVQEFGVEIVLGEIDQPLAPIGAQALDEVGEIGVMELIDGGGDTGSVVRVEGFLDLGDERVVNPIGEFLGNGFRGRRCGVRLCLFGHDCALPLRRSWLSAPYSRLSDRIRTA